LTLPDSGGWRPGPKNEPKRRKCIRREETTRAQQGTPTSGEERTRARCHALDMTFDARRPHETHAQHLHRLNKKCRREATTRAQQARDRQGHTDEDIRTRQARQAAASPARKEMMRASSNVRACARVGCVTATEKARCMPIGVRPGNRFLAVRRS